MADLLTLWTIRASLLLYAASLALLLTARKHPNLLTLARLAWTTACLLYLAHVASAFHFHHAWSHSRALAATARETASLTGLHSGAGLYLNYLFTALWTADVIWWWRVGHLRYTSRPAWLKWTLHAFMFFIAFNATIVFESGAMRASGLATCGVLAITALLTRPR